MIPTATCDRQRVRTGYERVIAHRVGRVFAGVAEKDGKVTDIDEKAGLVEVTYSDGTRDVFPYGDKYDRVENFEITQHLELNVTLNQKFKKGDILTYNSNYFYKDHFTNQVDFTIGTLANVAMMEHDTTCEDSCMITQKLAEKLTIYPVQERVISLSAKSFIHNYLPIGSEVAPTDPLMIFEEDPNAASAFNSNDPETLAMLAELNRATPRAKHGGKVVKIDAYYSCPISEMHPSLASIVREAIAQKNRQNKLASSTDKANEYPASSVITKGSKYKGVTFEEDTVMIVYHIQERIPHGVGDKLVFCNQLKNTCGGIAPAQMVTESGVEVDALFSQNSANKRVVISPILTGILSRVMEKLEDEICEEYFSTPRPKN